MIDLDREALMPLSQAARLPIFGPRRNGRRLAASTLWRWALSGCRGIFLETAVLGGVRCTSAEAVRRFVEATTLAANERIDQRRAARATATPEPARLPASRRKAIEAAERRVLGASAGAQR